MGNGNRRRRNVIGGLWFAGREYDEDPREKPVGMLDGRWYYFSTPRRLVIDLDDSGSLARFHAGLKWVPAVKAHYVVLSVTPGHFHGFVELVKPITDPLVRYSMQAMLGSDPMKEYCSLLHYRQKWNEKTPPSLVIAHGAPHPVPFFSDAECLCLYEYEGKRLRTCRCMVRWMGRPEGGVYPCVF